MAISKEIDIKEKKSPILLKGTSQSRCLDVKIGNFAVELWEHTDGSAQPYARLLFEPAERQSNGLMDELDEAVDSVHVDLDVMQVGTLSVTIEQWLLSFESETKDENVPSLRMQVASLMVTFYSQGNGKNARVEFVLQMGGDVRGRATLTRCEAGLLGRLLDSVAGKEESDRSECIG